MILWWLMAALSLLLIVVLVFSHRYAWWRPTINWQHPRILMYHMVNEHQSGAKFNKLRVRPAAFAAQMAWLAEQGCTFLTMSELRTQWQNGTLRPKSIALTFDDGYADNLIHALPVLQRHQVKATIYVVVDRHDRDWSTYKKAHHNSGELARETKLSDAQVMTLVNSGLIEIGSHTLTHANLSTLDDAIRRQELALSRQALQGLTGQSIESFAYPFGIYSHADVLAARDAGYLDAVTTIEGIDARLPMPDFLQLKRIKISGKDNLLAFKCRIRTGQRGA
jgi:peptidoglycan/xylan/chitin deacetylase (PgdA/CDA1 family)